MQISTAVLTELSIAAISADGLQLTLNRQVDRKLYKDINAVIEALGGRWSRRDSAHAFTEDVRPALEQAIVAGEVTTGADLGFFETPKPLAHQLVMLADVQRGDFCLEPSAGKGRLVAEMLLEGAYVVAVEFDRSRRRLLSQRFAGNDVVVIDGEPPWSSLDSDFMRYCAGDPSSLDSDFMRYCAGDPFDRVVMNPPFLRCGLGDHLDHVRHAYAMLVPGGVLVSVLSSGVQFRQDKRHREFRAWAEARGSITDLPDGAFKASGTMVRTCVVRLVGGKL